MANVDIRVGKKDAVFFSANPTLILKDGQFLFNSDTLELFIGDGTSQLSALVAINVPPSSGVQSVTGANVDNTDPLNPIVNNLGLIQIIDLNNELFTDLVTAKAYIRNFVDVNFYPITNESFEKNVFYFTVPRNSYFDQSYDFMSNTSASFVDRFGLVLAFGDGCFNYNSGNNYFGKPDNAVASVGTIFQGNGNSFQGASGINHFSSLDPQTVIGTFAFGDGATGKFIIDEKIGTDETTALPEFFQGSTATIFVNASKYISNAGGINANLQTAITNGCNVQFDGINLGIHSTPSKVTPVDADEIGIWNSVTGLLNRLSFTNLLNYLRGHFVEILYKNTVSGTIVTGAGTTSTTFIEAVKINAGRVTVGKIIEIDTLCLRNTASGVGTQYLYFNTTPSLTGATLMATANGSVQRFSMYRKLIVKHISTNTETILASFGTASSDPTAQSTTSPALAINWNNDVYIIKAFANAATTDQTTPSLLTIKMY